MSFIDFFPIHTGSNQFAHMHLVVSIYSFKNKLPNTFSFFPSVVFHDMEISGVQASGLAEIPSKCIYMEEGPPEGQFQAEHLGRDT